VSTLAFDIETDGLLHDLTRTWVLCIGDCDTKQVVRYTDEAPGYEPIRAGVERLLAADKIVAHNGLAFDLDALHKCGLLDDAGLDALLGKTVDTLVLGRLANPERPGGHSLESYGVELGVSKGSHEDWTQYSEEMAAYCETDIRVTMALYDRLRSVHETWGRSSEIEHRTFRLIALQMRNGFTLDVPAAVQIGAEIYDERNAAIAELQQVFPPIYVGTGEFTPKKDNLARGYVAGYPFNKVELQEFNPGSEHQVARRLERKYGWKAPLTEKGNPNITEAVLKKLDFPEVHTLLKFIRLDKVYSQVAAPPKKNGTGGGWLHHAGVDNRVRGYVNSNGAVTGRMTHSRPNSANIDKEKRLRALWIPKAGWVLVGCDAEGLELRMLGHYLAPLDGGAFIDAVLNGDKTKGTDAHSKNRAAADLHSRDGAKTEIYGLIYGAGDPRLGAIWVADWQASGKPKEEWPKWAFFGAKLKPLKAIGAEVRRRLEIGITGFGSLTAAVTKKVKLTKKLKGLDGRVLRARSEHAALNTLLQSGGAIAMKMALILFHEKATAEAGLLHGRDFGYCANVHDEVQIECRPDIAEWIGTTFSTCITDAGRQLGVRCRLDGDFSIGKNWSETH
jgi:DNA polymerase-1